MTTAVEDQAYAYLRPSALHADDGRANLRLSTSGGRTAAGPADHPVFFDGFLGHPEQAAAALLAVAKVARTRFYTPPGMLAAILQAADPVVTSNGDRLRFESFSMCCGVYARYDALPGSLLGTFIDTGTTNVDFNTPVREALSQVGAGEPLHLNVGEDVTVRTLEHKVTEHRVPLPERWIRGFAEVQLASVGVAPVFDITAAEARRYLRSLPSTTGRKPLWIVPAGRGLRTTTRPSPDGLPVSGLERLKPLDHLLRFARSMRGYGASRDIHGSTSVWELTLDDARFILTLSPESSRGFSGEGRVLADLADDDSSDDADLVASLLAFEPRIEVPRLARDAALSEARVVAALGRLGAAGRVGYDTADGAYFHRELPYDAQRLAAMHPRLRAAEDLAGSGAVRLDGDTGYVSSSDSEHAVRTTPTGSRCTCPWFARYKGGRGPCKHVLAVDIARSRAT